MAVGHHLEEWKNRDVFATVLPIFVKFGTVMHLESPQLSSR